MGEILFYLMISAHGGIFTGIAGLRRLGMAVSDLMVSYGIGKKIHYQECWNCWRFKRFKECKFRYWLNGELFCIEAAQRVDNRLLL